jgi:hypothetical protein
MGMPVPEVMVADHRDAAGGRRPDREGDAGHAVERPDMRTELVVGAMVVALAQQEEVVFRDRRQEAVRVVDQAADAVRIAHAEAVTEKVFAGQLGLEHAARVQLLHRDGLRGALGHQLAGAGPREQRTGHQAASGQRMQAQETVRRGLLGVHQGGQLCWTEAHPERLHAGCWVGKRSLPENT